MFKYPSPWQVLCSSLEKRDQVSVNSEEENSSLSQTELPTDDIHEYDSLDSTQIVVEEVHRLPNNTEDSKKLTEIVSVEKTKRELSAHTRNIHTDEKITSISEEQTLNITDTEENTASEITMDRVTRSLIFSLSSSKSIDGSREDLANITPEESQVTDKRKDVWSPPPDRNSKLKVLREEERFEVRSHRPDISPSKLFDDSDGEDNGNVRKGSHQFTPEKAWELEQERKDIIKKQGQRKSLDSEDLIKLQDSTDSLYTNKEVNGTSGGEGTTDVDVDQINFEAVRKQFMMLEKRNSLPINPRLQPRTPRHSSHSLYDVNSYSDSTKQTELSTLQKGVEAHDNKTHVTQETNGRERRSSSLRQQFLKDSSFDCVDTGEQEKSTEVHSGMTSQLISEEKDSIPTPGDETPIEREIRLALQREENLRKERGIQHSVQSKEIVEIQKNPVLSISTEKQLSKKSKDNDRTTILLKREIRREEQREADLKNEGKVPGLYDKGTAQELDERRKLFEQPDEIPVKPQNVNTKTTSKGIMADTQDSTNSVRTNWKLAPLNPYRTRRLSMDNILDVRPPDETTKTQESSEKEVVIVYKENFQVQPFTSGLHLQEDQADGGKDYKIEKTPASSNGVEIYNTKLRPSRSNVIEEEIRKTLKRDQELQEQRRKSEIFTVTSSKEDLYGNNQHGRLSMTLDGSRTWSPVSRKSTSSSSLPTDSPVQMFRPRIYPKLGFSESESGSLKRHENWYAGIGPSDAVNTEIVESTRVSRHKSKMALRWEAGLYANEPSQ